MIGERSSEQLRAETSPMARAVRGLIRRAVVTLTTGGIWQLAGWRAARETFKAEVFGALGLWARPPDGVAPDAIVAQVGADADHPVVIAQRDEATRAVVAGGIEPDTTLAYNSIVGLYLLPDGSVQARTHNGTAKRLATFDDLSAHRSWDATHTHSAPGGVTGPPAVAPPAVAGTDVLRGE